jgi:regulator of protease activity HflC (stomatin/prohibitin superfamily)
MIEILVAALAPLLGAVGSIRFVREGERAIMLRFDKAVKRRNGEYKVIMPGLRLMIPGMHKLARIHVRQRTINFPGQTIVLADNTVFEVSAVLMCRVKDTALDLYNALFETTGINVALTDFGLMVVREVLGDKEYDDLFGDTREEIAAELMAKLQPQANQWGVNVLVFELSDCRPNAETARLIQVSAQTDFRVKALTEAANELGVPNARDLPPSLAAVLVGAPLVASASITSGSGWNGSPEEDPDDAS